MRTTTRLLMACGLVLLATWAWGQEASVRRATELREVPEEGARSLQALAPPVNVTRLPERQGPWTRVRTAQGQTGWVKLFDLGGAVEAAGTGGTAGINALRGLTSLLGRGNEAPAATTASTMGIRGLGAEDIARAQPNPKALTQAEQLRVDAAQAQRFAAEAALAARTVAPLPEPTPPAPAGGEMVR